MKLAPCLLFDGRAEALAFYSAPAMQSIVSMTKLDINEIARAAKGA